MPPEIMAEFIITGINVTPDEITKAIGITPTETWKLGDLSEKTTLRKKHNGWRISTGYHQDFDLEKYIKQLFEILLPKSEIITTFCRENELDCELSCAAYVIDETPSTNFSKKIISDLAKLNASLDFDIILTSG